MNDLSQKREFALEADAILKSDAWQAAKTFLREDLVNLLLSATTADERVDIIGEIKAIDGIGSELKRLVNDYNAGVRQFKREKTHA